MNAGTSGSERMRDCDQQRHDGGNAMEAHGPIYADASGKHLEPARTPELEKKHGARDHGESGAEFGPVALRLDARRPGGEKRRRGGNEIEDRERLAGNPRASGGGGAVGRDHLVPQRSGRPTAICAMRLSERFGNPFLDPTLCFACNQCLAHAQWNFHHQFDHDRDSRLSTSKRSEREAIASADDF